MHLSHKNDCWAELKGQAKRQTQSTGNKNPAIVSTKQARRDRESLIPITTVKSRAERQLAELNDLLKIMQGIQVEVNGLMSQEALKLKDSGFSKLHFK